MFKRIKKRGRSVTFLIVADYYALVFSFVLAMFFRRYSRGLDLINLQAGTVVPEIAFILVYGLFMLMLYGWFGLYQRKVWMSPLWHAMKIVRAVAVTVGVYFLFRGMFKEWALVPSRFVLLLWAAGFLLGMILIRLVLFPLLVRMATRGGFQRRVVVVGFGPVAQNFMAKWRDDAGKSTIQIVGYVTDLKGAARHFLGIPCLGEISSLSSLVMPHHIEGAVLANPDISHDELLLLIDECVRLFGWVDVHSIKSAVWHADGRADFYFDIPFIRMAGVPRNPFYLAYKRGFDVVASTAALLLLSPFLLAVLLSVRMTSPGPVFYIRHRIGRNGKPFPFYKIRSMRIGADQDASRREAILEHMSQPDLVSKKVVNTNLVTPIGAFIRKWAVDEVPQLWNVIRGDMSLVGPRPLPHDEYEAQADWQKRRFEEIRPGCTGLWKVYAVRTGISFTDTALYDIYYARNMNPMLDLSILLQTAWVVVVGKADG